MTICLPVKRLADEGGRLKDSCMYLAMKRLKPVPIDCSATIVSVIVNHVKLRSNLRKYFGKSGISVSMVVMMLA